MSNHIVDAFVGFRFTASIGEPWDFVSSIGQNRLDGEITAVALLDRGQPCFLCSVTPFTLSGVRVDQVIGVNRYISSQDLIKVLKNGGNATMNFVFRPSGAIAPDDITDVLSGDKVVTSFLVGSMKLVNQ